MNIHDGCANKDNCKYRHKVYYNCTDYRPVESKGIKLGPPQYEIIDPRPEINEDPLQIQIAGTHYKKYKIQPLEFAHANNLDMFQGSVVKYITRFRDKNGKEDLEKAKHIIDILIKLEYGEENANNSH